MADATQDRVAKVFPLEANRWMVLLGDGTLWELMKYEAGMGYPSSFHWAQIALPQIPEEAPR